MVLLEMLKTIQTYRVEQNSAYKSQNVDFSFINSVKILSLYVTL